MSSSWRNWLSVLMGFAVLSATASAQAPKVGKEVYEDAVDIGFRMKSPKGWDFVPPSPLEVNSIGQYKPPRSQHIEIGGGASVRLGVWLLKFDKRPDSQEGSERQIGDQKVTFKRPGLEDIHEWMKEGGLNEGKQWKYDAKKYPKPVKGVKEVPAEYYVWEGMSTYNDRGSKPRPINCYIVVFTLSDDLQVAFAALGPNDKKKWKTYESTFTKMSKSFKLLEVERKEAPTGAGSGSPRALKRAKLENEVAKSTGWELYETPSYFVISSNNDKEFMKEILERLEAIRAIYEEDYPAENARVIRETKAEKEGEEGDGEGESDDEDMRSVSAINPMEMSRTSVVRVCKNRLDYQHYGGPPGSAGYWSWVEEELVIYDDKEVGGRENTWLVLNHEAFHQYIFYFYGNISPHYWYNEGTGDFYSGYKYEHKRFKLKEAAWRVRPIQQNLRDGKYAPLKDFVRWSRTEYYGTNDLNMSRGDCYAQGWSFIWFLRTGKKKAKGWNDNWDTILDTYLSTFATNGDLDEAVDAAFAGVDWDKFEKAWKNYVK